MRERGRERDTCRHQLVPDLHLICQKCALKELKCTSTHHTLDIHIQNKRTCKVFWSFFIQTFISVSISILTDAIFCLKRNHQNKGSQLPLTSTWLLICTIYTFAQLLRQFSQLTGHKFVAIWKKSKKKRANAKMKAIMTNGLLHWIKKMTEGHGKGIALFFHKCGLPLGHK